MAKLDIFTQFRNLDNFLQTLDNPLHRHIILNYKRHALLEITAQTERIFDPEMTVEHPVYYLNVDDIQVTLDGYEQVIGFYSGLESSAQTVMVVEDEQLAVADWGFASESIFNTYMLGSSVSPLMGAADPDKHYIVQHRIAHVWPYDERGRLKGEHVYEHVDHRALIEIPEEDVITLAEAREKLTPLIVPLKAFEPVGV